MKIKLHNVRVAFLKVFTAERFGNDPKSKPQYGAALVIDPKSTVVSIPAATPGAQGQKGDYKLIDQALVTLAKEKWKDKAGGTLNMLIEQGRVCFLHRPKVNSSGEVYDGFESMYHLNASRAEDKGRPLVIDGNKNPLAQADGKPYSGCYCNVTVELWAQDNSWGKRINATLLAIQFVRDGDAFSGGSKPTADDFDEIADGADAGDVNDLG